MSLAGETCAATLSWVLTRLPSHQLVERPRVEDYSNCPRRALYCLRLAAGRCQNPGRTLCGPSGGYRRGGASPTPLSNVTHSLFPQAAPIAGVRGSQQDATAPTACESARPYVHGSPSAVISAWHAVHKATPLSGSYSPSGYSAAPRICVAFHRLCHGSAVRSHNRDIQREFVPARCGR